jgi:hypothetical protein
VTVNTYQPPGVYVSDVSQDMVTPLAPGLPENLLCIVGPAQGYQAYAENIVLVSASGTPLTNSGVLQDSSLVVKTLAGTVLEKDADYAVSTETVSGRDITKITRLPSDAGTASPNGVANGDTVRVTYRYTSADYYEPRLFQDYNSLVAVYGPALSNVVGASDPVSSPLSLAAKIAFENGAGAIIALAVDHAGTWREDFQAAYTKLVTDHRVSVLVPVFPDSEVDTGTELTNYVTDARIHVDAAAASGFGRTVLVSGSKAFDETSTPFEDVAVAASNKRIVAVYPTRYNILSPEINQTVEVGGQYACAALGGRLVLNAVEQALTRQPVLSFTSIPATVTRKMTAAFKDNLAANGVLVIEPDRTNRLRVRHGLTTDMSALTTREISLVRISDVLLQDISVGMDQAGLIGSPIDADMTTRVKGALMGILEQEVQANTIDAYDAVFVRQQSAPSGDPSVIECQFAYKPAIPLNYITVTFALNMNTGVVTNPDDTDQTA